MYDDYPIEGKYQFFLGDELIHEEKNALTFAGRGIAIKSLLGIIPSFAGQIGVGVGSEPNNPDPSTNLIINNNLQFEITRVSVDRSSISISDDNDVLIYSGTLEDPDSYSIYEVGLFPEPTNDVFIGIRGSTIFSFSDVNIFTQVGTASGAYLTVNAAARIGNDMMYVPEMNGTTDYLDYTAPGQTLDFLDTFTERDTFRLAGFDIQETSSSIVFRYLNNESNYYDVVFNTPAASGYFIAEVEKSAATAQGSPTWTNISNVHVSQTSASGMYLDGLRIDTGSYFIDTNTGMISRAVLNSPIRKPASIPLTIRYSLNVGFNIGTV